MKGLLNWRVMLPALLFTAGAACAQPVAKAPVHGPGHDAVASANFHATEAGLEVLSKGGNAFDAAVAVAAALSVVEPESSGLGGGFMAVLHRASDGKNVFIDARETAPLSVDSKDYLNADGTPNRDTALNGPFSAGIPGEPAGLAWIAGHYGKLPLKDSLAPAIRLATDGFPLDHRLAGAIAEREKDLRRWPASVEVFLPDGKLPAVGQVLRQPAQARTLQLLAEHGRDGFYRGDVGTSLVAAVNAAGGRWSAQDFDNYQVKEREPISVDYRGYRIVTAPPPSSGGVAIAEILNILSNFDTSKLDEAHRTHLVIEAMRRAFRDHNDYLGDPDFVTMPLAMLLSPYYADGLAHTILPDKATPSSMLPATAAVEPGMHTTHFSIVDKQGNIASITLTVNYVLGSTFVAKGTGVLLNDEMDDFALVPNAPNVYGLMGSEANKPVAGKRPLSSMSPSIVFGADRVGVIGSPGGSTIITQVLEGILAFIDGKDAAGIAGQKRYHHQFLPDRVDVETGAFDPATAAALTNMGYTLKDRESWGFMNVVTWDLKTNTLDAAADPRRESGLGKVQ